MFDGICRLGRTGISPEGRAQLELVAADGSWPSNWFLSNAAHANQVLAVALTAVSTGKQVQCQINDPAAAWSEIIRIVIVN